MPRPLRALQVEVTSRCTRRCVVCARTALAGRWLDGDVSEATWQRLRPDLALTEHVHLQGWGEPLLHPNIRLMVRDAHAAGCRVGLTTNGDLLADAQSWLVTEELDLLAVSLAGLGETNRRLRDDADAEQVLQALAEVARQRGPTKRPVLHVSFLLTRDNAHQLPEVVGAAGRCGADAVLVSHLDARPTESLRDLSAFSRDGVPQPVRDAVEEADRLASRLGVELRRPALEARHMLTCDLDPLRFLSMRWDGRVGPCVLQTLAIDGPVHRWADHGVVETDPEWYGNLDELSLSGLLRGAAYSAFTGVFRRRIEADRRFRDGVHRSGGWGVLALDELETAHQELERRLSESPFPAGCQACPKQRGW